MGSKLVFINIAKNLAAKIPDDICQKIRNIQSDDFVEVTDVSKLSAAVRDADYIISYPIPYVLIKRNKNLKAVFFLSSQVPDSFMNKSFKVFDIKGLNAAAVSDHALRFMQHKDFIQNKNSKVGVVGFGHVGKNIYSQLRRQEYDVCVLSRQDLAVEIPTSSYNDSASFFEDSDVLFIAANLSKETQELFTDDRFFKRLKKDITLINIARGELFLEQNLVTFFSENKKAHYFTDVVYPEPYPDDGELHKLDNIVMTPHVAGFSKDVWNQVDEKLTDVTKSWGLS